MTSVRYGVGMVGVSTGLGRLWWIHVGFIGLYALVAYDRADAVRDGAAWQWAVPLDVGIGGVALIAFFLVPVLARDRLGPGGIGLARWSLAEVPALLGIVTFLSGGSSPWLATHLALSLLLLALSAPGRAAAVDP